MGTFLPILPSPPSIVRRRPEEEEFLLQTASSQGIPARPIGPRPEISARPEPESPPPQYEIEAPPPIPPPPERPRFSVGRQIAGYAAQAFLPQTQLGSRLLYGDYPEQVANWEAQQNLQRARQQGITSRLQAGVSAMRGGPYGAEYYLPGMRGTEPLRRPRPAPETTRMGRALYQKTPRLAAGEVTGYDISKIAEQPRDIPIARIGSPPAGYQAQFDETTGSWRYEKVPGETLPAPAISNPERIVQLEVKEQSPSGLTREEQNELITRKAIRKAQEERSVEVAGERAGAAAKAAVAYRRPRAKPQLTAQQEDVNEIRKHAGKYLRRGADIQQAINLLDIESGKIEQALLGGEQITEEQQFLLDHYEQIRRTIESHERRRGRSGLLPPSSGEIGLKLPPG